MERRVELSSPLLASRVHSIRLHVFRFTVEFDLRTMKNNFTEFDLAAAPTLAATAN
jgi:hypothetical protein